MTIIKVKPDYIARMIGKTEFDERWVQLNAKERGILKLALSICERAGELQKRIIEREGLEDDGRDNDFAWAAIYLRDALGSD